MVDATNTLRPAALTAAGWWRVALAIIWPPALVAAVYGAVGRLGFYPTDEGLMQAYTYRILHGQVPHRDFISPRPLGSALLHLIDFAIPGPLFEVARVVAMCEYIVYAALFAWLIHESAPWRWPVAMSIGAAASMLVNLNVFPLMAWYTVDGLVFVSAGFVLVHHGVTRNSRLVVLLGFLVIGIAALTKQSFIPAPAFGWLLLVGRLRWLPWRARIGEVLLTGFVASLPSLVFVATIAALGGLDAMRSQLLGTGFVYGRPLVAAWSPHHDFIALVLLATATAGLALTIERVTARYPRLAARLVLTAVVIGVPLEAELGAAGNEWGNRVFWMAGVYWCVRSLSWKSPDVVGFALLGTAWMSSLSYGFAYPNFVGGTLAVYILHRAWAGGGAQDSVVLPRSVRLAPIAAALLALLAVGYVLDSARTQHVYLDRPAGQLTASLQGVAPAFGDIRTNPETARYLAQMADCARRFPARQVAILPENAAMYPALGLDNPFPIDWMWPDDVHGSEARILSTVDRLNAVGDYLVLFQTIGEPQIVGGDALPSATSDSTVKAYTPIPAEIYARLNGVKTTCATFLVVYSPPPAS
jgi:hypothetical protein